MGKSKGTKSDAKKEPVKADEKNRIRALKVIGHDFALSKDAYGRDRMAKTAILYRDYDVGDMKSVVRVRNVDPLKGMSKLTWQQQKAGKTFRDDYEICAVEGLKTGSMEPRVDGGGGDRDRPERITIAHRRLSKALEALGYGEIRRTVTAIAGEGMSARELASRDGNVRDVVSVLLTMGLQRLAVHYGIVSPPKRVDSGRQLWETGA